jgi:uncharacterized protein (TIGR02598 family)
MTRRPSFAGVGGFSLVEVALAMGIASFALVAVLGLLRVAIDADADAGRDTALSAMSAQILNELQTVPFDALWAAVPATVSVAEPSLELPKDSTYYFTVEGTLVNGETAATDFSTAYQCVVKKTADPDTRSLATGQFNKMRVRLEFTWPPGNGTQAATTRTNTQFINASIARY